MDEEPCRVLVCDDNRDAADAAVTLLQIWGHQAMTAYSAAQCIAVAKVFNPDIVLADHLTKPVEADELKHVVDDQCAIAKAAP
jgi:CheY-like chemotaxis protein